MKRIISYLLVCIFLLEITYAQQLQTQPQEYTTIQKNIQSRRGVQSLCNQTITFFEPPSSNSVGYGGVVNWRAAMYIDSVEFTYYVDTPTIEAIQFQIADLSVVNSVWIRIYEDASVSSYSSSASLSEGTEIYAADVTADAVNGAFGIHTLTTPITIDKNKGYLVAIELDQNAPGFPMSVDNGPARPGKGSWISANGAPFGTVSVVDANWAIRVCTDGKIIDTDYNVSLNDALFIPTGYEVTPLNQLNPAGYNFWIDVENEGNFLMDAISKIDVNSGEFIDSIAIDSIVVGNIKRGVTPNSYLPNSVGVHNVEASARINASDFDLSNNRKSGTFNISDPKLGHYSRTTNSNFYTANARFNGNTYEIFNKTSIKSVRAEYFNPSFPQILSNGTELLAQIWEVTSSGTVGNLVYTSDTLILDSIIGSTRYTFEFPFSGNNTLSQGEYLVAVSNPGCLLTNTAVNFYENNTAFGNSNLNNPNWTETSNQYYRVDLLLSSCESTPIVFSGLDTNYCLGDPDITFTTLPVGGIVSGIGTSGNTFSPSTAGAGIHTIYYTLPDSCNSIDSITINVIECTSRLASTYDVDYGKQVLRDGIPTTSSNVRLMPINIGGTSYRIEVNTASDFSGTSWVQIGTDLSNFFFMNMPLGTTFYVRVKVDGGSYGITEQFMTHSGVGFSFIDYVSDGVNGRQGVGQNVHPRTETSVYIHPRKVNGASEYTIEISDDPNFAGTISQTKVGPTHHKSYYHFTGLPYGAKIYVRVMTDLDGVFGRVKHFVTREVVLGSSFLDFVNDAVNGNQGVGQNIHPITETDVYIVPRRVNGASEYTVEISDDPNFAGTISETKTGPTPHKSHYQFTNLPQGTEIYVRVITDLDDTFGKVKYFITKDAPFARVSNEGSNMTNSSLADYSVYPNPSTHDFYVRVDTEREEDLSIVISNLTGKVLYESMENTNQTIKMGSNLGEGMYIMQLTHGETTKLIKVVKK